MDCIFCKIINNEIKSYTIYEDEVVKCFLDINPYSPGHVLIIPKKHYLNLEDIDIKTLKHINETSKKIFKLLKQKLEFDGLKIVQNNGNIQEVKHYHMHLIPMYNKKNNKSVEEIYNIIKKDY